MGLSRLQLRAGEGGRYATRSPRGQANGRACPSLGPPMLAAMRACAKASTPRPEFRRGRHIFFAATIRDLC